MSEPRHTLDEIQRWMQVVITHPGGPAIAIASPDARSDMPLRPHQAEQVISPSRALTSLERLEIYYRAYYARLLDCLREEYSALAAALGDELFDSFAVAYLQQHPSQSYTLGQLGANFPEFLAGTRPPADAEDEADWPSFMIDLARLERVVNEVFDGPGTEGQPILDVLRLQAISPADWPTARLVPAPCLRLLELQFPVNEFFSALRRKQDAPLPRPGVSYLSVTRRDYRVRRLELTKTQFELLRSVLEGSTIGEAVSRAAEASSLNDAELAAEIRASFQAWAAEGFFVDVITAEDEHCSD